MLIVLAVLMCYVLVGTDGRPHDDLSDRLVYARDSDGCTVGKCVIIHECREMINLLKNLTEGNRQRLQEAQCGFEGTTPKVCCPAAHDEKFSFYRPFIPLPDLHLLEHGHHHWPPTVTSLRPPLSQKSTTTAPPAPAGTADHYLFPLECGDSGLLGSRISGGSEATPGSHPWMAALAYGQSGGSASYACGGALINPKYILTAAHCLVDKKNKLRNLLYVRLGDHDLEDDNDVAHSDYEIDGVEIHPDYTRRPFIVNDIGLVRLKLEVNMTANIAPVCLPIGSRRVTVQTGTKLGIAGWGSLGNGSIFSPKLQEAEVPVIQHSQCQKQYASHKITVTNAQICASKPKVDSCAGDSGGPLTSTVYDTFSQIERTVAVGVLSYGGVACDGVLPGVYTKVTSYGNWLWQTMYT